DVRGIAPIGRLLLPAQLKSDQELRAAAAQLQCDMLLVYTLDTSFHDRDALKPLTVVTLGLSPTNATNATTTASAVPTDPPPRRAKPRHSCRGPTVIEPPAPRRSASAPPPARPRSPPPPAPPNRREPPARSAPCPRAPPRAVRPSRRGR